MAEHGYATIYEKAKAHLEEIGKPDLLDLLRPVQPGVAMARAAFDRYGIKLRMLCASEADTTFDFLGKRLKSPIMTSSMGDNGVNLVRPGGFRMLVAGARRFGAQCWIGECGDSAWSEVAAVAPALVRIVKPWKDEGRIFQTLALAEERKAFAVGMDVEVAFSGPDFEPKSARALASYVKATRLPFIVKGVGSLETARAARDAGAAAIVAGTHGGGLGAAWGHPLETLPEIAGEVGQDVLVLAESGARRGEDVLKLLARGAKGVLMGRALLLGLAAGGADGVAAMLEVLNEELKKCMVMAGCPSLASITEDILVAR